MASVAPYCCPSCGNVGTWKQVDESNKGFSIGKAAVGGALIGPIGLLGGALGKKTATYYCQNCGFRNDYKAGEQQKAPSFTFVEEEYATPDVAGINTVTHGKYAGCPFVIDEDNFDDEGNPFVYIDNGSERIFVNGDTLASVKWGDEWHDESMQGGTVWGNFNLEFQNGDTCTIMVDYDGWQSLDILVGFWGMEIEE